jgi:hypothetical protein
MHWCVEALSAQFAADAHAGGTTNKQKSNHENFKKGGKARPTPPSHDFRTEVCGLNGTKLRLYYWIRNRMVRILKRRQKPTAGDRRFPES